jgi:hypothetical protein
MEERGNIGEWGNISGNIIFPLLKITEIFPHSPIYSPTPVAPFKDCRYSIIKNGDRITLLELIQLLEI